ncbi:protein-L-isoaspartate O-methyltransferase family protein [Geminicoccus roseus]|uniref:protein-L-isoaspartate O-methyltransferase family protein n=1 Tax=Geminicoccus roseus TaxID=404900 RepID=UPI000422DAF9|nr:protein-L-isoaspartate O-methyltransferase [Geminicoccus roseus]
MNDYAARRHLMVEAQLRPSAIEDENLLRAMGEVPREAFLPRALKGVAYGDEDIQLGDGRRLIEPLVLGKLLQAAAVKPSDVALVIGCTTGYSAAVLSRLTTTVFCVDPDAARLAQAEKVFAEIGGDNVVTVQTDPAKGHPAQAPFDLIVIAGAVETVPETLKAQLADGGRLVTVLKKNHAGKVAVVTRVGDAFGMITPFDAGAPQVPELRVAPSFTF